MDDDEHTFRGTVPCAVDTKRRFTVPARFAKALTPRAKRTLVAVRGQGKCLDLYPLDHWLTLEKMIKETSFPDPETRKGIRRWMATMEELVMDNQGRVTLSPLLLADMNITSQAILYGALDHLELWGPDGWKDFLGDQKIISIEETIDRLENVRMQANVEVALERSSKASPRDET